MAVPEKILIMLIGLVFSEKRSSRPQPAQGRRRAIFSSIATFWGSSIRASIILQEIDAIFLVLVAIESLFDKRFFKRRDHYFLAIELELSRADMVESPTFDAANVFGNVVGEFPIEKFEREEESASGYVVAHNEFFERVERIDRRDVHIRNKPP